MEVIIKKKISFLAVFLINYIVPEFLFHPSLLSWACLPVGRGEGFVVILRQTQGHQGEFVEPSAERWG